ncbi:MAG: hypothetical protein Alpg2KO_30620 [Alphaproteobacteria bacterium]
MVLAVSQRLSENDLSDLGRRVLCFWIKQHREITMAWTETTRSKYERGGLRYALFNLEDRDLCPSLLACASIRA